MNSSPKEVSSERASRSGHSSDATAEPQPNPIQNQINDRRRVEREYLAKDETTGHSDTQRAPEFRSSSMTKRERKSTEESGHRGHHDGAKAKQTCFEDGVSRVLSLYSLRKEREVNHHNRVLLNNSDKQDDADDGDHVQLALKENQGKDGSDTRRRQSGKDRNWVHQALMQDPQHDVDRE